jgi:23S rRNA pseudouridine2604 synthase
MTDLVRLDKRVATLAECSREQARRYIEGGWVTVDGAMVDRPHAMVGTEAVALAPGARPDPIEPATMLLHKPAGVDASTAATLVRPATRSEADDGGLRQLSRHFHQLTVLMPLDTEASGLLVLSQDPRAVRRLSEDRDQIEQEYVVEVAGDLAHASLGRLAHGLRYRARSLPPCKVSWQNETRLRFAIKAVQPGQLQHMCEQVGLAVLSIRRIRIGRIPLGKLPAGQWRYLPPGEKF